MYTTMHTSTLARIGTHARVRARGGTGSSICGVYPSILPSIHPCLYSSYVHTKPTHRHTHTYTQDEFVTTVAAEKASAAEEKNKEERENNPGLYACMLACMHAQARMHVGMCACTRQQLRENDPCMTVCMYVCVCVCARARACVCLPACMHACMHANMYVCIEQLKTTQKQPSYRKGHAQTLISK